jgi:hypothetical protein
MQLHELHREVERFLFGLHIDDRVAADQLLGLGERSVDDAKLTVAELQESISAYYFTPTHSIFVGGLVAIGVALIAVKGSTDLEDALLNVAGVLAPIVAFVPTSPPRADDVCKATGFIGDNPKAMIDNNLLSFAIGGFQPSSSRSSSAGSCGATAPPRAEQIGHRRPPEARQRSDRDQADHQRGPARGRALLVLRLRDNCRTRPRRRGERHVRHGRHRDGDQRDHRGGHIGVLLGHLQGDGGRGGLAVRGRIDDGWRHQILVLEIELTHSPCSGCCRPWSTGPAACRSAGQNSITARLTELAAPPR